MSSMLGAGIGGLGGVAGDGSAQVCTRVYVREYT